MRMETPVSSRSSKFHLLFFASADRVQRLWELRRLLFFDLVLTRLRFSRAVSEPSRNKRVQANSRGPVEVR